MFKSIRWRLQAWHAAILVAVVAGFGGSLYGQLRSARLDEIDAELHAAARVLDGALRGLPPPVLQDGLDALPPERDRKKKPRPPKDFLPISFSGFSDICAANENIQGGTLGANATGVVDPYPANCEVPRPSHRAQSVPPGLHCLIDRAVPRKKSKKDQRKNKRDHEGRPRPLKPPPLENMDLLLSLPHHLRQRYGDDPETAPYSVIWLAKGDVLHESSPTLKVPAPAPPSPVEQWGSFHIRQRDDLREVILLGPRRTRILVGRSIQEELAGLNRIGWQFLLTGLGVLAVGLTGGWLLSRHAIKPIETITSTAAKISASSLSQRIDVSDVDSELGKLGNVLNETFARLEAAFAQQVRFTADASHELRTPLSIMHSQAELALRRPRSPEEHREIMETCLRACARMRKLVDQLLTLARADAGQLELSIVQVDCNALVAESLELVEPLARSRNIKIEVNAEPVMIWGDSTRLGQVVTNLLTNAIHYNCNDGLVRVTVATQGQEVVLAIGDTGPGIAESERKHVFERFYRADRARSREVGGSGLGLAICRSIVEAHGGTITFTTEIGKGTRFVVTLPGGSKASLNGKPTSSSVKVARASTQ